MNKIESIWRPASVTAEPEVNLSQWAVFRVAGDADTDSDTVHFVGDTGYEGRVCSPIKTYDPTTRRGITQSGRIYGLVGKPGLSSDARYVWGHWLSMCGNPEYTDITESYKEQL